MPEQLDGLISVQLSPDESRALSAYLGRLPLADLDSVHATESDVTYCWRAIARILEAYHASLSR